MKHHPVNAYYNMYRLITNKREHLCVAISKAFELEIEKAVEAYGAIQKVPVDKTVRGIFMECLENHNYNFDVDQQENDIVINQLRPFRSE